VRGRVETQRHRGAEKRTIETSQRDFSVFSVTLCFQLPRGIGCAVGLKHRDTEAQRKEQLKTARGTFSVLSVTLCFQLPRGIRCAVGLKHRDTEAQR
jgi:hypothetical protein